MKKQIDTTKKFLSLGLLLSILFTLTGCSEEESALVNRNYRYNRHNNGNYYNQNRHIDPYNNQNRHGQHRQTDYRNQNACITIAPGQYSFNDWANAHTVETFLDQEIYEDVYQMSVTFSHGSASIRVQDADPDPLRVDLMRVPYSYNSQIVFEDDYGVVGFILEQEMGNNTGLFSVEAASDTGGSYQLGYVHLPFYPIDCR